MILIVVLLFVFSTSLTANQSSLVITDVTVIDSTGSAAMPHRTVLISGNRISSIGKNGTIPLPKNANVIDGAGKFLIPGLWDMHVHLFNHVNTTQPGDFYFPLLIANGVTSVRDLWTKIEDFRQVQAWRKEFIQGKPIPRIQAVGTMIDGPEPIWPEADTVATPAEARQAVNRLKANGIDFVKVYWNLSRESYFAIADESQKQNIPFVGHVPFSVTAAEASEAGQRSIEHLTEILLSCSTQEEKLRQTSPEDWSQENEKEILETYDAAKCVKLFSIFVKNETWQVPILGIYRKLILDSADFLNDPRLKYITTSTREDWKSFIDLMNERSSEQIDYGKDLWQAYLKVVDAMRRAGVKFMVGTDMGIAVSYIFPGFSVHDEMALLVEAGFTTMEALQASTRNPAEFLKTLDSIGTIEKGKIADLVLLEANPLDNIRNTEKIAAVILDGKLLTKEVLQKMLKDIETSSEKK